jgi:hypothetical protein
MIFPEHLPDETLASLWARQARLNGYADGCAFVDALFPNQKVASFIDAEIHFPSFCKAVGNAYGTVEAVTKAMTNLHAQVQIGELDLVELGKIENGNRVLRLGDLTFFGTTTLNYCRSCVTADIGRHGISYWHRLHQLPVMLSCPEHGDRLARFASKRSRLHESFPLPGDALVQSNGQEAAMSSRWMAPETRHPDGRSALAAAVPQASTFGPRHTERSGRSAPNRAVLSVVGFRDWPPTRQSLLQYAFRDAFVMRHIIEQTETGSNFVHEIQDIQGRRTLVKAITVTARVEAK